MYEEGKGEEGGIAVDPGFKMSYRSRGYTGPNRRTDEEGRRLYAEIESVVSGHGIAVEASRQYIGFPDIREWYKKMIGDFREMKKSGDQRSFPEYVVGTFRQVKYDRLLQEDPLNDSAVDA